MRRPCAWKDSPLPEGSAPRVHAAVRDRLGRRRARSRCAGALDLPAARSRAGPRASLAGERGRHCGRCAAARALLAIHDAGWLSEETEDDPARLRRPGVGRRPDRRHARLSRRPVRTGRVSVALVSDGPPGRRRALCAGDRRIVPGASPAAARRSTGRRSWRARAMRSRARKFSGPKRRLEALAAIVPHIEVMPRIPSLALRLARVANRRARRRVRADRTAMTGTLRRPTFWCTKPAGVLPTLTGQSLIYNRPDPVHGALVAAGRARHTRCSAIRDRLAIAS